MQQRMRHDDLKLYLHTYSRGINQAFTRAPVRKVTGVSGGGCNDRAAIRGLRGVIGIQLGYEQWRRRSRLGRRAATAVPPHPQVALCHLQATSPRTPPSAARDICYVTFAGSLLSELSPIVSGHGMCLSPTF